VFFQHCHRFHHELILLCTRGLVRIACQGKLGQPDRTITIVRRHAINPLFQIDSIAIVIMKCDVLDKRGVALWNFVRAVSEKVVLENREIKESEYIEYQVWITSTNSNNNCLYLTSHSDLPLSSKFFPAGAGETRVNGGSNAAANCWTSTQSTAATAASENTREMHCDQSARHELSRCLQAFVHSPTLWGCNGFGSGSLYPIR